MSSSTNKKAVIQRFDRESLTGFVNPGTFLTPNGVEILSQTGVVSIVGWADLKTVWFVRDFASDDPSSISRSFLSRPKLAGLWVRLVFRDGDTLEGVMPNNLLDVERDGVHIVPPQGGQRVFVPRTALRSAEVLGVIGSAQRRKPAPVREQPGLFEGS